MSVRLAVRVVTDTHTDTHTDDVKTITPDTSQTWGVKIRGILPNYLLHVLIHLSTSIPVFFFNYIIVKNDAIIWGGGKGVGKL